MDATRRLLVLGPVSLLITAGAASAGGLQQPDFDAANFTHPLEFTNPYFPLPEHTTFTYRSEGPDGCEVDDVTVTDVTPVIDQVTTREVHDEVWLDDDCDGGRDFRSENTLDRYAEDDFGNDWYMGEDTAEYCDRSQPNQVCSTEGSWTAGVDAAEPGFIMLADPTPGEFYPQEYLMGEAEDMAKVLRTNAKVSLRFDNDLATDDYTACLETKEWSPLEKGVVERKSYFPGLGLVLTEELTGGQTVREELVSVSGP